jgi:hypothetical protein
MLRVDEHGAEVVYRKSFLGGDEVERFMPGPGATITSLLAAKTGTTPVAGTAPAPTATPVAPAATPEPLPTPVPTATPMATAVPTVDPATGLATAG